MAVDKLVDSTQLDADLTSVANAIRTKGGTSGQLAFPAGFVSAVQAIPTGTTPTGTKQISITENGTTTEDVAAYANAEINVNVQGGGTEVTAISSASNAIDCRTLLFPGAVAGRLYVAVLKTLVSGTKIADQVEFLYSVGSTGNIGGGVRWRNNDHGIFGMAFTYDTKIQTGDVFLCYDFPLV